MKGKHWLIGIVVTVILVVMGGGLSGCAAVVGGEGCDCPCCEAR